MPAAFRDVREFCLSILESGDLAAKLRPPRAAGDPPLPLGDPRPALYIERPARAPELRMRGGAPRLPHPRELDDPDKRARCLRRFAHHELMAVELFAWALLLWPDAPPALRRGWLETLADEQRHLRMYLDRLSTLGTDLGAEPLSDYFWRHVPQLRASPHGPLAFLAAMGLTLEQANLDFTLLYRDAFRAAGDEESARVSQVVHDEEQRHVRLALSWLLRLKRPEQGEVEAYEASLVFPLSASRAKGRVFSVDARRAAGLSEALIEHVGRARSPQEQRKARPRSADASAPRLLPNLGAEEGERWRRSLRQPAVRASALCWGLLFGAGARFVGADGLVPGRLPEALQADAARPAFAWLPDGERLVPWLASDEAQQLASRAQLPLGAAPPDVVRRVHDKAFALHVARAAELVPEPFRCVRSFDAAELEQPERALAEIAAALSAWPERLRRRFVLKPRFGSSGRGRVAGRDADVSGVELRGALDRLARLGGALLEPWLERTCDLSAQLFIADDGELRVLATLEQLLTPEGVPIGHRGVLDATGQIRSGTPHDDELCAAARAVGQAAGAAGYRGPCGVDAFVFIDQQVERLRPVVEFNARYTLGSVAAGLLERARRAGCIGAGRRFEFRIGSEGPQASRATERLWIRDASGSPCASLLIDCPVPEVPSPTSGRVDPE